MLFYGKHTPDLWCESKQMEKYNILFMFKSINIVHEYLFVLFRAWQSVTIHHCKDKSRQDIQQNNSVKWNDNDRPFILMWIIPLRNTVLLKNKAEVRYVECVMLCFYMAQYCCLNSCLNVLKALHTQRNNQRFSISPNSLRRSYLNSWER